MDKQDGQDEEGERGTTKSIKDPKNLNNVSLDPASPEQDPFHGAGFNGEVVFLPPVLGNGGTFLFAVVLMWRVRKPALR